MTDVKPKLTPKGTPISIEAVLLARKLLVEKYERKSERMSVLIKKVALYAYKQATDDMLKAMDEAKVD